MPKAATRVRRKTVRFSCDAKDAHEVCLVGTFNDWAPGQSPLRRGADGEWFVDLKLAPGRYEYKFIVDGQWCCEPGQPDQYCDACGLVCNEHGTMNRVIDVV